MGAVLDEVVGPDVIAVLCPQPDAWSVRQPEPAAFGLPIGDLQPLASPDTLDPLVVDDPARLAQQSGDLAITVATILSGKLDNIGRQPLLVSSSSRPRGILHCVERCCPSAAQARRSAQAQMARTISPRSKSQQPNLILTRACHIVQELLRLGNDPREIVDHGYMLATAAAEQSDFKLVNVFLEAGVRPDEKDPSGESLLDMANRRDYRWRGELQLLLRCYKS